MKTTPVPLLPRASKICAAYAQRDDIQGQLVTFDADAAARLAALDNDIAELDQRADGEDVGAVQMLIIKREQRSRLAAKLASDRSVLLARVQRDASAAVTDVDLTGLFKTGLELEIQTATAAMLPFFENEIRARGAAGQTDSVNALQRWVSPLCHEIPAEIIAKRLRKFAEGTCEIWKI